MARFHLEQIREEVESHNWKLISTSYKNLKEEMEFECPKGHKVITSYEHLRRKFLCPTCEREKKEQEKKINITSFKKKNDRRVLALDQATHITGWAIYENDSLIRHGAYEVLQGEEAERISDIKNWVWNLITVWKIDCVYIEDIQLQDHSNNLSKYNNTVGITTYKTLAHLQGVLIDLFFSNDIRYNVVPPGTWRKFCGIKGKSKAEKKKSAQLKVQEWYSIITSLDEAEAICIGKYGISNESKNNEMLDWG